jgi:hypothetical protein
VLAMKGLADADVGIGMTISTEEREERKLVSISDIFCASEWGNRCALRGMPTELHL